MFEWFESLPSWVRILVSLVFFSGFLFWSARDRVRSGAAKTYLGGVAIELMGLIWCLAGVVLVGTSLLPVVETTAALRYFSSSVFCAVIAIFCFRASYSRGNFNSRSTWAGMIIAVVATYLFYKGWMYWPSSL